MFLGLGPYQAIFTTKRGGALDSNAGSPYRPVDQLQNGAGTLWMKAHSLLWVLGEGTFPVAEAGARPGSPTCCCIRCRGRAVRCGRLGEGGDDSWLLCRRRHSKLKEDLRWAVEQSTSCLAKQVLLGPCFHQRARPHIREPTPAQEDSICVSEKKELCSGLLSHLNIGRGKRGKQPNSRSF